MKLSQAVKHQYYRDLHTFVTCYPPAYQALSLVNGKVKSGGMPTTCFFNCGPAAQFDKMVLPMIEHRIICNDVNCADFYYEW